MSDEFKEDIGKQVKFFMKNGMKYTGEIKRAGKNNTILLKDMFNKPVKINEDDYSSCQIDEEFK